MQVLIDNYATPIPSFWSDLTSTVMLEVKKEKRLPTSLTVNYQITDGDAMYNRHQSIISAMEALTDNWDGEGALAPDKSSLQIAKSITHMLWRYGQPVFHIAPGPVGEIMINLRNGDKSLELLFYPNHWKYVRFSPHEKPQQGRLEFSNFSALLSWLNN